MNKIVVGELFAKVMVRAYLANVVSLVLFATKCPGSNGCVGHEKQ